VELVRKLGASTVIDYQLEDFTDNGESYDVIFDTADGGRFNACRGSLNKGGRYVSVYLDTRMLVQMLVTSVFGERKAISSVVMGNRKRTEELAALLEQRAIRPVLAAHFSLDQIVDAHTSFEHDRLQGAVTIRVSPNARYARHEDDQDPATTLLRHSA
ncbi:MAG: zinc-binding dehydrogenase, partial [Nannocystaceae bacterium]